MDEVVTLLAAGDVFVDRDDPATAFHAARPVLQQADIVFGNCEGAYSDEWERAPSSGSPVVAPAANARQVVDAGFHVMSLANNHSVDGGHGALLTTRDTLIGGGVQVVGAGPDIAIARESAVVRRGDTTVAFLAYSSVFPHGYEARAAVPGLAPLRAHTRYTPWELNEWNPGLAPRVSTETFPADLAAFTDDIRAVRETADVVVVSVHWGDFTRPYHLTDHEIRCGHAAVEAGADVVLGHHQHMLRGVEFHRGAPIFYGLGHYLFDLPNMAQRVAKDGYLSGGNVREEQELDRRFGEYRLGPRSGYPRLPFHPDSRLTGLAAVAIRDGHVAAAGWAPAVIDPDNEPVPVDPESPDGKRVAEYLATCIDSERLATRVAGPDPESGLPPGCFRFVPAAGHSGS